MLDRVERVPEDEAPRHGELRDVVGGRREPVGGVDAGRGRGPRGGRAWRGAPRRVSSAEETMRTPSPRAERTSGARREVGAAEHHGVDAASEEGCRGGTRGRHVSQACRRWPCRSSSPRGGGRRSRARPRRSRRGRGRRPGSRGRRRRACRWRERTSGTTVPWVASTPTLLERVAWMAARAPGSMTPMTSTSSERWSTSRPAAVAVLQAMTTALTSRLSSHAPTWRTNRRTSAWSRGP